MILYSPILAVQQPGNKETDVTSNTTARNCNNDDADGSNECQGCSKVLFMAHRAISDQPTLLFSCINIKRSKIRAEVTLGQKPGTPNIVSVCTPSFLALFGAHFMTSDTRLVIMRLLSRALWKNRQSVSKENTVFALPNKTAWFALCL